MSKAGGPRPSVFIWAEARFFGIRLSRLLKDAGLRVVDRGKAETLVEALSATLEDPELLVLPIGRLDPSMVSRVRDLRAIERFRNIPILGIASLDQSLFNLDELRFLGFAGLIHTNGRPEHIVARVKGIVFDPETRRECVRAPAHLPVEIEMAGHVHTETALSLSVGGMRFTSGTRLMEGTPLIVRFRDDASLRGFVTASARCLYTLDHPGEETRFEVGAAFEDLSQEARDFLDREVRRLLGESRASVLPLGRPRTSRELGRPERCRVLVLGRAEDEVRELREALDGSASETQPVVARSMEEAKLRLEKEAFDVILSGGACGDADQQRILEMARRGESRLPIPVILVLPGGDDPIREAGLLEEGASDVLTRPLNPERLLARIRLHRRMQAVFERVLSEESSAGEPGANEEKAGSVPELIPTLRAEIDREQQLGTSLSLIVIRLDERREMVSRVRWSSFTAVRKRLEGLLSERFEADEFTLLAYAAEPIWVVARASVDGALACAEWLRKAVEATAFPNGKEGFSVTVTMGVSNYSGSTRTPRDLIAKAQRAVEKAQNAGGNRVEYQP